MTRWNTLQTIPKRYVLCLLAFVGLFNTYILRSNLSIAIITMVQPSINISSNNITEPTGYDWNTKTQGYILSSFFYSYTITQIPAGILATTFGGKFLFAGSIAACAVLTLFTPLCAQMGPTALIILRIIEGFSSGFIYPSLHCLWSKWAPKNDRSKMVTFALSGHFTGIFVAMMLGGLIAAYWSWEWIFYLSGISGLIWTLCWIYLIAESPATHSTISNEESTYIQANLFHPVSRNYPIPWREILTSLPVWAIISAHFGTNWCIYLMLIELPSFLTRSLGYRVDEAGGLAAIPWLATAVLVYATGLLSDKLTQHHSTTYVRKLIVAISFITISSALLLVTVLDTNQHVLIILGIMIAVGSCGPPGAGYNVNHLDIGAHYAGALMGLSNCVASMPGFIIPILTGYIVENPTIKGEWNIIFIITIFIVVLVLVFYTVFASGELQPWASNNTDEYQHVLKHPVASRDVCQDTSLNENHIDYLTDCLKAEIQTGKSTE